MKIMAKKRTNPRELASFVFADKNGFNYWHIDGFGNMRTFIVPIEKVKNKSFFSHMQIMHLRKFEITDQETK